MWLLVFISLVLVQVTSVKGECSTAVRYRVDNCIQTIQSFLRSRSPSAQLDMCPEARRSIKCLKRGLEICPDLRNNQITAGMDYLEKPIKSMCPTDASELEKPTDNETVQPVNGKKTPGKCRKKDRQTLRKCAAKLKTYAKESPLRCGKITRALRCVSKLMATCGMSQKKQTRVKMIEKDVIKVCVKDDNDKPEAITMPGDLEMPEINVSECPRNYMYLLNRCNKYLNKQIDFIIESNRPDSGCSAIRTAWSCVRNILGECAGRPGVARIANTVNEEQIHSIIYGACPAMLNDNAEEESTIEKHECPPGRTYEFQKCLKPMTGFQSPTAGNVTEYCRVATESLDCVKDLLTKCANKPDMKETAKAIDIDKMIQMVKQTCSGKAPPPSKSTNKKCPADYVEKLSECNIQPNRSSGDYCRVAATNYRCLVTIFFYCKGQPSVDMLTEVFDLETMKEGLEKECPYKFCKIDPNTEINKCKKFVDFFQTKGVPIERRCRSLNKGFNCYERLVNRCPTDPDVEEFTSKVNITTSREVITSHYCPKSNSIPKPRI